MVYWVIMAILLAIAIGLIIAIIVVLKGGRYQDDYEDNYEQDDIREADDYPQPVRGQRRSQPVREPQPARNRQRSQSVQESLPAEGAPRRKARKQWKIILENLDTWEKPSYIFYDNIGIGRSRSDGEFEKFLVIREDPRVSKVHCAIIRKEDKLYLKDMGSRNGTFLNGQRIYQPVVIQRDDVIGVGGTKIEVKKVLRERD